MVQFPNPCFFFCFCFFFSHSNSALGLHRLELNENTVNVMHMFFLFYFIWEKFIYANSLGGSPGYIPNLLHGPPNFLDMKGSSLYMYM